MNQTQALALLKASEILFDEDDEMGRCVNLNDTWGWACADGENVADEEVIPLANLFFRYGWAGVLYWCSKKRGGQLSEFYDINRMIEFVKNEEAIRAEFPDSNKRAYHKAQYAIKGERTTHAQRNRNQERGA